jgi:hypothetical protein
MTVRIECYTHFLETAVVRIFQKKEYVPPNKRGFVLAAPRRRGDKLGRNDPALIYGRCPISAGQTWIAARGNDNEEFQSNPQLPPKQKTGFNFQNIRRRF